MDTQKRWYRVHIRPSGRLLAMGSLAALLFGLAGGHVRSQATPPKPQDPLDLLDLQAKPNAIIILDVSGSMRETKDGNLLSEDHALAKLRQAKEVLTSVITANQETVAFAFGTYDAPNVTLLNTSRFHYVTTNTASPNMTTMEIVATATTNLPVHRTTNDKFTEDGVTQYNLYADKFVNGQIYTVTRTGTYCSTATGTATNPASITLKRVASSSKCTAAVEATATFTLVGAYDWNRAGNAIGCLGYREGVPLAECSKTEQLNVTGGIAPYLRLGLLYNADGTIQGYSENANGSVATQPTAAGMHAAGATPIAESLIDLRSYWDTLWTTRISTQKIKQATFAIVLTDGDDTCFTNAGLSGVTNPYDASTLNANAQRAAYNAQRLYWAHDNGSSSSHFKTFVVAFGSGADKTRADWIAMGGSGMQRTTTNSWISDPNGGTANPALPAAGQPGSQVRWASGPTDAEMNACTTCQRAFPAANKDQLTAALQKAIDVGRAEGDYADRSVMDVVYEYVSLAPATPVRSPLDPTQRYSASVSLLVQSAWEMPDFKGHLQGFLNEGGVAVEQWDAGDKLRDDMLAAGFTDALQPTFATMISSNLIRRRIYTSSGNGTNTNYAPQGLVDENTSVTGNMRVQLWPPETGVDPTVGAGSLDTALALNKDLSGNPATVASLQADFGACKGTLPSGHACLVPTWDAALKEAREMILANMAGAQVVRGTNNVPVRDNKGNILYTKKAWVLADATASSPAISSPPPDARTSGAPAFHQTEYTLFTDGPRHGGIAVNGLSSGFGLTNPDYDSTPASANDLALKPVMTVVYHAANDMLHAFRAGPCPSGSAGCAGQTGGEELWGFVPYDQLAKLKERLLKVQTRDDHTYMLAAPVRLAHVWVPGDFTKSLGGESLTGTGVWRMVVLVGRGPGGKFLTALDVTMPGATTTNVRNTAPPIFMWNRGNDGNDAAFAGMGETWSVPAVVPVDPDRWGGVEFVAFTGSGYSDVSNEGATFYALNAITGDVLHSFDVGSTGTPKNAIAAGPTAMQPNVLKPGQFCAGCSVLGATDRATLIYFNDVQGRIYRYDTATPATAPEVFADYGTGQPFGVSLMAMNFNDGPGLMPHVYGETGADNRVKDTSPFKMMGLRDNASTAEELFVLDFEDRVRGTIQPAGAYSGETDANGNNIAVTMFAGTRFTPATTQCFSQFDSILYLVLAANGNAAFDLPSSDNRSITLTEQKLTGAVFMGGQVVLSQGLGAEAPDPPPPAVGSTATEKKVAMVGVPPDPYGTIYSPLRGTTTFKIGTSVCR